MRRQIVWLHRWTGLLMAGFLIVVGVTGSLLAFYGELNHLLAPEIYGAPRGVASLDAAALARRAEMLVPDGQISMIYFGYDAPVAEISMEAKPETPPLDFDYIYLDRHTGAELGRMFWGAAPTTRAAIMPFIYQLHMTLVAGDVGAWILGLVALAWTVDCFVGFYLTLPEPSDRSHKRFLTRWKPAWLVKLSGSFFRVNFDLHRAGGLWLWLALLIFAWSGVYMNLNGFYTSAMSLLFDYQRPVAARNDSLPNEKRPMSWDSAQATARRLMAEQAQTAGFETTREVALILSRDNGVFEYRVHSSRDIGDHSGQTSLTFDAATGEIMGLSLPTGAHFGNTLTAWLYELHKANVFGLPYKMFVSAFGLVIAMLSVTGAYIWWRKRRARRRAAGAMLPGALAQESR